MSLIQQTHVLLLFMFHIFNISLGNFQCIDLESAMSATVNGATTSIGCIAPYTLVDCGFRTNTINEPNVNGVYHNHTSNKCTARNAIHGNGVYASARCCILPENTHCISAHKETTFLSNENNEKSSIDCRNYNYQYLFGCNSYSYDTIIDGSFYGTQYLNTVHYNQDIEYTTICTATGKVYPSAICCNSSTINIQCSQRFGTAANGIGAISTSTCDASGPYPHLLGCTGWSDNKNINAWYSTGNTCNARGNTHSQSVYAASMCCNINPTLTITMQKWKTIFHPQRKLLAITKNPSTSPTIEPTHIPSNSPTIEPTVFPTTDSPSTSPT
eukprot:482428_1